MADKDILLNTEPGLPPELAALLLRWYDENARDLPWRRDNDPYRVWVSEIMLQQTGTEVVSRYYPRFLETYPTVAALAAASEQELMKLWEGLGYYSRARNMQKAAREIVGNYGGVFPDTVEALQRLPGVGEYTAGAVASICFHRQTPAVDGNVVRVVARIAGIGVEITEAVKKSIGSALSRVYPPERPGDFTQSLMDLGAVVCLPNGRPRCESCPTAGLCTALRDGTVMSLPVKKRKPEKKREERTVFLLACGGRIALRRRNDTGLLGGLWELPNVSGILDETGAVAQAEAWGVRPAALRKAVRRSHIFTHIRWDMLCYEIACRETPPDFTWVTDVELRDTYALPTAFGKFLDAGNN